MKKTAYFLLLLLLIGACGCRNRKTSYPPLIRQAEYWAEACPDSAIACLDSIDASLQELTEEERMYCHMLRIKAEDKLYIPHTSDSLINRIVRFYEQQGDDRRLAEALYYKAGVYRDCNEPSRAIRTYLSAAEVGCNYDTLNGRIYGQLAVLYAYQKAYHESMKALRQALVYNIRCKNDKGVAYGWRDMARIFDRQYSPDSAEVYYSKAYNLMKEKGFIETSTSHEDKRMKIVRLTGKEDKFVKDVISEREEMEKQLVKGLTQKDQENLRWYLKKMYENLTEAS